jgi:hypothetical protein
MGSQTKLKPGFNLESSQPLQKIEQLDSALHAAEKAISSNANREKA